MPDLANRTAEFNHRQYMRERYYDHAMRLVEFCKKYLPLLSGFGPSPRALVLHQINYHWTSARLCWRAWQREYVCPT
jgi:hypothetical protein